MSGLNLAPLAIEYVKNLPKEKNLFASKPTYLRREPWEARTLCSTFITQLLMQSGVKQAQIVQQFGSSSPFAKDYYDAIENESGFKRIEKASDLREGDLLAIKFKEKLDGFTGHCALILNATKLFSGQWMIQVCDSTGSPHGALDPRATAGHFGIGTGHMILLTDSSDRIEGYQWSRLAEGHLSRDGLREVVVGRWV